MSPTSEKIKQYVALKPIRFNSMSRFEWMTIPLVRGYSQQLLLHLTPLRDDQKRSELILTFQGVRNVRFERMTRFIFSAMIFLLLSGGK